MLMRTMPRYGNTILTVTLTQILRPLLALPDPLV